MAEPPLDARVQVTVAKALKAVAVTPVGTPGSPTGVTVFEGAEDGPLPTAL